MERRAITKTRLIRLKTPRARIPGSHGERPLICWIGSMHPLDQNARRNKVMRTRTVISWTGPLCWQRSQLVITKSLKLEGAEDNGVNSVFWKHKSCILRVFVSALDERIRNLKIQNFFIEIGLNPNSEFIRPLIDTNEAGEIVVNHVFGFSPKQIYLSNLKKSKVASTKILYFFSENTIFALFTRRLSIGYEV